MFLQCVRHRHLRESGAEVALHGQGAAAAEDRPEGRDDAGEAQFLWADQRASQLSLVYFKAQVSVAPRPY